MYGGIVMAVGMVLTILFSEHLMALFSDDPRVISTGTTYLRIDALVFYAYVILFINVAALQGIKRPMYAIWIGVWRQIAAPFMVFYILTKVLN